MARRTRALKGATRAKSIAPTDEAALPRDLVELVGQLREEIFLLETLMDNVPDTIYFKDRESRFTRVNRHAAGRYGIASPTEAVGRTDADYFTHEHAAKALRDEQEIIRTGKPLVNVEERETLPEGEVRWVSTTKLPLRDRGGNIVGTFGISRDITHRKKAEELLRRQAFYDALTNLPNRALFFDRLQHLFQRGRRALGDSRFALLYLDVDRFKTINDTFGHQAGDEVLIGTVRRIERCLRPADTLARLGGDEFAILLDDIRTDADATRVADRIREELATPLVVRGRNIVASVSIGIALSSAGHETGEDMLRDADTAMYKAKAASRLRAGPATATRRPT